MKKIFTVALIALSIASIGASCKQRPPVTPVPTPPIPADTDDCGLACQKLRLLGCIEGTNLPGPDGKPVTCEEFCRIEQRQNNVELNPSCVKTITSCDQVNTICAVGHK